MQPLKKRLFLVLVCLVAVLIPVAVYAYTICHKYSDGCTICDFYSPNDIHQGSIEWCH